MEYFPKNITIEVELNNPHSIRAALHRYQQLLYTKEAFKDADFSTFFNVEFVSIKDNQLPEPLQLADAGSCRPVLDECFQINEERYVPSSHVFSFGDGSYVSEVLFFAHALQFNELKNDIIETAKAMVHYARCVNDTSDMWVDDMHVFGLEALYLLARIHPDCSWLLAQLHIPYWDFEHVIHSGDYLSSLLSHLGWTKDTINAYVWCDSTELRYAFYAEIDCGMPYSESHPSLAKHLQQHPDDYHYFQHALIQRFKEMPLLAYSKIEEDEDKDISVVAPFFLTMQIRWDESEDEDQLPLQEWFINGTLENEIHTLEARLHAMVYTPLIVMSEKNQQSEAIHRAYDDNDHYVKGKAIQDMKAFFVDGFNNGADLWDYIQHGNNLNVLNDIEPVDIAKLIKDKNLALKQQTDWHLGSMDAFDERLHRILGEFCIDLFDESERSDNTTHHSQGGLTLSLTVRLDSNVLEKEPHSDPKALLLRTLDVFQRLMDVDELHDNTRDMLVDEYNVISHEAFDLRYTNLEENDENDLDILRSKQINMFNALIEDIYNHDVEANHLRSFDRLVSLDRPSVMACDWNADSLVCHALAAHQIRNDFNANQYDELTQYLIDFISESFISSWLRALFQRCHLASSPNYDNHGNQIKKGLSKEEVALITQHFTELPPIDGNEKSAQLLISTLLKQHLKADEDRLISQEQPYYKLFSFRKGQPACIAVYFLSQRIPLKIKILVNRLLNFYVEVAPQRTLNHIIKTETPNASADFGDIIKRIDFFDHLIKIGIPASASLAYQAVNPTEEDYDPSMISIYSEINSDDNSMFGSINKRKAQELEVGLQRVKQKSRLGFYHRVQQKYPEFTDLCQPDIDDVLTRFSYVSIDPSKARLDKTTRQEKANAFHQHLTAYLSGDVSLEDMQAYYHLHCDQDLNTGSDYRGYAGIEDVIWKLDTLKRDRLVQFLIHHSISGVEFIANSYAKDHDDGYSDEQQQLLLDYLLEQNTPIARLIEYSLTSHEDVFERYLLSLAHSKVLFVEMNNLHTKDKLQLLDVLDSYTNTEEMIAHYLHDQSPQVVKKAQRLLS
ncbi:hypothetical protein PVK69_05955 [Aliivibrio sp. S4MY2]|nr:MULTISPECIES: hypothetical protein [unclassified Aliivibrio]MDD9163735.1 hypothetical protein [Aliivibrio sp. S4MY2]MDD9202121.1 hypothetical protein [Aliivibrio sp. S4MY1]